MNTAAIALYFVAFHMIGDYVTQTNWMAANKFVKPAPYIPMATDPSYEQRVYAAVPARTIHVLFYSLPFLAIGWLATGPYVGLALFAAIFVPHWIIDCRRWASPVPWAPKPILVDQSLHALHLAIVFHVFFGR